MPKIVCDNCGVSFSRKTSKIKRAKLHFCSVECHREYRRTHCNEYDKRKVN